MAEIVRFECSGYVEDEDGNHFLKYHCANPEDRSGEYVRRSDYESLEFDLERIANDQINIWSDRIEEMVKTSIKLRNDNAILIKEIESLKLKESI